MFNLAQLPLPAPGALENWLISAATTATLFLAFRKVLARKPGQDAVPRAEFTATQEKLEREVNQLRDRMDERFLHLNEKLDQLKSDLLHAGELRGEALHRRLGELEAGLARVDERTRA